MAVLAVLMAAALAQGFGPTLGGPVVPKTVRAEVAAPDAVSLLRGRQAVQVHWQADLGGCDNPYFRIEVADGQGGPVLAKGELNPSHQSVDWEGYAITFPQVPATVAPQLARVQGCCGLSCTGDAVETTVHAFLPASIWVNDERGDPPMEEGPWSTLLGTDGRGGVWLAQVGGGHVLRLPLLGLPQSIMVGARRALLSTWVGGESWLIDSQGIHAYQGDVSRSFTSILKSTEEEIVLAARQTLGLPGRPVGEGYGPCAIGAQGTIWCRLPGGDQAVAVARLGREVVSDARVQGAVLWLLLNDARLLRLNLDTLGAGLTAVLTPGEIAERSGHRVPQVLGGIPGTDALWLAEAEGHLWRVSFDEHGAAFDAPIRLPTPFLDIRQVEADGLGRVAVLTAKGVCTIAGRTVGCWGKEHGWHPDLLGIGWALPGVLWVGDRFLLTAPSTLPSLAWAYVSALGVGILMMALLVALAAYRFKALISRGPRAVAEALAAEITQEVGWGPAIVAIGLPQILVLAVDRLMTDLHLTGGVVSRLIPTVFFLCAFMGGLLGIGSREELRRIFSRAQLPALLLVSLVWALFLTLWVWPLAPLGVELDGKLTLMHLALAVVTGVSTLLYLMVALGRERA